MAKMPKKRVGREGEEGGGGGGGGRVIWEMSRRTSFFGCDVALIEKRLHPLNFGSHLIRSQEGSEGDILAVALLLC